VGLKSGAERRISVTVTTCRGRYWRC